MGKKIIAMCSTLLVLLVSIAVLLPSCASTDTDRDTGFIVVEADLCGDDWEGAVNYTLTAGNKIITGDNVPYAFNGELDTWTCAHISGSPAGAHLESITPSPVQSVSKDALTTFTLNFELGQDAGIEFAGWTIDGTPAAYDEESGWHAIILPYDLHTIEAHFIQWVGGCPETVVAVNETSWLQITQTEGPVPIEVKVENDSCAVIKEAPPGGLPAVKKSQVPSSNGEPIEPPEEFYLPEEPALLDLETSWELEKCLNYTQSISWIGFSLFGFFDYPCVLFNLRLPQDCWYTFTLVASAEVALVDDEDVNPNNNYVEGLPLTLLVACVS
jgi:hypothetical protein